jgi:hypothetical protein
MIHGSRQPFHKAINDEARTDSTVTMAVMVHGDECESLLLSLLFVVVVVVVVV